MGHIEGVLPLAGNSEDSCGPTQGERDVGELSKTPCEEKSQYFNSSQTYWVK